MDIKVKLQSREILFEMEMAYTNNREFRHALEEVVTTFDIWTAAREEGGDDPGGDYEQDDEEDGDGAGEEDGDGEGEDGPHC